MFTSKKLAFTITMYFILKFEKLRTQHLNVYYNNIKYINFIAESQMECWNNTEKSYYRKLLFKEIGLFLYLYQFVLIIFLFVLTAIVVLTVFVRVQY